MPLVEGRGCPIMNARGLGSLTVMSFTIVKECDLWMPAVAPRTGIKWNLNGHDPNGSRTQIMCAPDSDPGSTKQRRLRPIFLEIGGSTRAY